MDRYSHPPYVPYCPQTPAIVDQYMREVKDTNTYKCETGISNSVYSCDGSISYTLPLEMYPERNSIHPEIKVLKYLSLQNSQFNKKADPRALDIYRNC